MSYLVPIAPRSMPNKTAILPDMPVAQRDLVSAPPAPCPQPPVLVSPLPIARTTNATQPVSVRTAAGAPRKQSQIVTLVIPAGGTFPMAAFGNKFMLVASPIPIPIRYDPTGTFSTYSAGMGITVDVSNSFTQLEFQNPQTIVPITIQVFFGWDDFASFLQPNVTAYVAEGSANIFQPNQATQLISGLGVYVAPYTFRRGFFYGVTSLPNSNNTIANPVLNKGNVYIGINANLQLNKGTTYMPDTITPGNWIEYDAPPGLYLDLSTIWITGTQAGDNVYFRLM